MAEYRKIAVSDIENSPNPTTIKKEVDEALDIAAFGFNVYTVKQGEQMPWGYHYHPSHEEVFYVCSGSITVETADGTQEVNSGEIFYVPPGSPNRAYNPNDEPARVIAVGAPKDEDDSIIEEYCHNCEAITERISEHITDEKGREGYRLLCAQCNTETNRFFKDDQY
ncbi:MAG: cupin domain-containing protein [Halobacteriaceae archaeon]